MFAISGHADLADAVPERSTGILMFAGFAGLGLWPADGRRDAGPPLLGRFDAAALKAHL